MCPLDRLFALNMRSTKYKRAIVRFYNFENIGNDVFFYRSIHTSIFKTSLNYDISRKINGFRDVSF